jgi:RNA polymerase sigma-70 factor (ECF subfamily)
MPPEIPLTPRPEPSPAFPAALVPAERALVAAVLARDRKAAAQLVAAHVDAVYGYVRHRLSPQLDLVEDVVQDVFLAALTQLVNFHGTSPLRAWLLGIARHKVEDVYRQRLRSAEPLSDGEGNEPVAEGPPIDQVLDSDRLRVRARSILAKLPERYALALQWRYWEQRHTRQIAEAIGTTEKSVERTLARARARFKQLWLQE